MSAIILDGKKISMELREKIKTDVNDCIQKGITPGLAVIIAGNDPASVSYVNAKEKALMEAGMSAYGQKLPEDIQQADLISLIQEYNKDKKVHGILVQLPLPSHINESAIMNSIDPEKDVDGFTPVNIGKMIIGQRCFLPCTPHGVLMILRHSGIKIAGAHVVIVGRSNIVGKPLMNLLLRKENNATVTVCHTGTQNLESHTKKADILIACAGKPGLVNADMVKPGACVIDVGVNRIKDENSKTGYRLIGDVDFESVVETAGYITPVPGGVGPMTITMLLSNTLEAAKWNLDGSSSVK